MKVLHIPTATEHTWMETYPNPTGAFNAHDDFYDRSELHWVCIDSRGAKWSSRYYQPTDDIRVTQERDISWHRRYEFIEIEDA